ncbi:hypothetical protein R2360_07325 [Mycobacteroides chelonae]|uniref:DUF3298 domain-containing protein n=1 Tax=Mycobacteroides chelonae TaxID=1774 RepID=A0AB73U053_MYCCH|nr:hypothetical protein [Mycobacteroides chelonae]MEC4839413.1 hypothetical protein [Mycobacteroides chelonae]MEC4844476.1 hypothetical protein [Mycobacteroides chelonae]OLT83738.1 hypothetical protein BKG57_02190 [Mycobacteroides chelonae]QDF70210.1 hypothetical protein FJK96_08680 [Mycobacteroides chelonae]WED93707.1 hypothetical protein PXJ67_09980 [Mycobacteroides chelonae]
MSIRGGVVAAVAMCVVASGCGRAADEAAQAPTATESSSGTTSSAPPASPAPAFGYTPVLEPVKGAEGMVTYDVPLPQLSGGVPAVRDRFNDGMRSALRDVIDALSGPAKSQQVSISEGDIGPERESTRVAMIGPHVVAGIQVYLWYAGGAHPNQSVSTFVVNSDTAQPITYDDLFPNQYAALERLRQVLPDLDPTARVRQETVNGRLEQWIPVPAGLRFYVPVSHAAGDFVPITVPWEKIRDQVAPEIIPVLSQ